MTDPMLPPGTNRCQCPRCGRYFGGIAGFDRHLSDEAGGCVDPATVGMIQNDKGYWVRPAPDALALAAGSAKAAQTWTELTR